ncbi:uncharacterized protein LOC105850871 isoform X1 [Hydra vulgaris]|uniref:Uncharacterized protein LOC105850871 isoform X1 n=2 Tax=Hydra vulgaris TaxID=6087 RepID=A0ABM4CW11_HYDVU
MELILSKGYANMKMFKYLFHRTKQVYSDPMKTKTVKVLVMGKSGVGKTSVIRKLCDCEDLLQNNAPTCYDVYQKDLLIDEYNVTIQFMDLGGLHAFPSMQDVFIRQADIFLLVYSADDPDSFNKMVDLRKLIVNVKNKHSTELPIIVVRNKCDLKKTKSKKEHMRKKSVHQWCYLVHDVSAKTCLKINAIMDSLIEESKFIGNSDDLGSAQYSGKYVYNEKLNDVEKKIQYHKPPSLFHNYDNSDEKMEKRRRKIARLEQRKSPSLNRFNNIIRSSFRKLKRNTSLHSIKSENLCSENHNDFLAPSQLNDSKESSRKSSKSDIYSKDTYGSRVISPTLKKTEFFQEGGSVPDPVFLDHSLNIRKKSLSSNDLVLGTLDTFQEKHKLLTSQSVIESEQFLKPALRARCQTEFQKKTKPSKLDIVHTTLRTDVMPENYQVPIYSRSMSIKQPKTSVVVKDAIEEEDPSKIYPVPQWRGSNRHSLISNKLDMSTPTGDKSVDSESSLYSLTYNLYSRRKSVSVGDIASLGALSQKKFSQTDDQKSPNTNSEESVTSKFTMKKKSIAFNCNEKRKESQNKKMSLQPQHFKRNNSDVYEKDYSCFTEESKNIKSNSWNNLLPIESKRLSFQGTDYFTIFEKEGQESNPLKPSCENLTSSSYGKQYLKSISIF